MSKKKAIAKAKIRTIIRLCFAFGLIRKNRKLACKNTDPLNIKSSFIILKELVHMTLNDFAYLTAERWNVATLIDNYFEERIHLKSSAVCDYLAELPAILVMRLASSAALKRILTLDNKETFWNWAIRNNFPTTARLGTIIKDDNGNLQWRTEQNELFSIETLLSRHPRVFVKPADGMQGYGCEKWELKDELRVAVNEQVCNLSSLHSRIHPPLLVEEIITQHADTAAFHPSSLNTIRMVTMKRPDGRIELECSFLRVGVGELSVDNFCHGGIVIPIEDKGNCGELTAIGRYRDFSQPDMREHPDSHVLFEGYPIPYFAEAKKMVLHAHSLNKGLCGVGWDVAVTPNGPLLVEANPYFAFDLIQATLGGYRKLLYSHYLPQALKYSEYSDILI